MLPLIDPLPGWAPGHGLCWRSDARSARAHTPAAFGQARRSVRPRPPRAGRGSGSCHTAGTRLVAAWPCAPLARCRCRAPAALRQAL